MLPLQQPIEAPESGEAGPRARLHTGPARLYLFTPLLRDAGVFVAELEAALEGADVAAVLLRCSGSDRPTWERNVEVIAPAVQRRGVALLVDGAPELVARSGADGAHCHGLQALTSALRILKPDRIVGAGGLTTRHEAMVAGEAGADYVMFGEPDAAGRRPGLEAVIERVAWWAELFEPPCVAYARNLDEVAALAGAGADFIATDAVWSCAAGPAAGVRAVTSRLRAAEPA